MAGFSTIGKLMLAFVVVLGCPTTLSIRLLRQRQRQLSWGLDPAAFLQLNGPDSTSSSPSHSVSNVVVENFAGRHLKMKLDESFAQDRACGYSVLLHYTVDPAEDLSENMGLTDSFLRQRIMSAALSPVNATASGVDLLVYASKKVGVDAIAAVKSDILARLRNNTRTCFCKISPTLSSRSPRRRVHGSGPRFYSRIVNNVKVEPSAGSLRSGTTADASQPSSAGRSTTDDLATSNLLTDLNTSCSCLVNASSLGEVEPAPPPPKVDREAALRYRYPCAATTLCHTPADDTGLVLTLDAGDRDSIGSGRKRWWRLANNPLFQSLVKESRTSSVSDPSVSSTSRSPTRWYDVSGSLTGGASGSSLEGKLHNRVEFCDPDAIGDGSASDGKVLGGGALHFSFSRGLPPVLAPTAVSVDGLDISPSVHPQLTVEVWVNLDLNSFAAGGADLAKPNSGFVVGCGDYAPGSGRRAIVLHDAHFSIAGLPRVAMDPGVSFPSSVEPLRISTWHHVVAVWQQGGFSYL